MFDSAQPSQNLSKYTISLTGSQISVATYGIVEFLRRRAVYRGTFAVLGIVVLLFSFASMAGMKFMFASAFGTFSLLFVGPWLLWAATVSGPDFTLVFAAKKAQEERREAEKQFEKSTRPKMP
jgi:hypothetical protein